MYGKWNPFAKVCKSIKVKLVHGESDSHSDNETDEFFLMMLLQRMDILAEYEQVFANIKPRKQGTDLKFKFDTGAQVKVIPLSVFYQLKTTYKLWLQPTSRTLTATFVVIKGMCKMYCADKDCSMLLDFYVVNTKAPPVQA